jgi:gliding motility-associated-like protein
VEGLCDSATLRLIATPVNDPPALVNDTLSTPEDTPVDVLMLANDTDIDGFIDGATVSLTSLPAHGTALLSPAGWVAYSPDPDGFGIDSFRYRACDNGGLCGEAWVFLTVLDVNDAPLAGDDFLTLPEDGTDTARVIANDTDADGTLDTAGLVVITPPANGTASPDGQGGIVYTPDPGYGGPDSLRYRVCDDDGACATAWLYLTVVPVNDPPLLVDDAATVDEDENAVIDVLANDSDPDGFLDPASVTLVGLPVFGTATVTPGGQVKLTPPADWTGVDSFRYRACDDGGLCDTATGVVTVLPLADPPSAVADTLWTDEDVAAGLDPLANDSDPEGDLDPASFSVLAGPYTGAIAVGPGSWLTYAPPADWSGRDSLRYRVCDLAGACAEARVLVLVAPVPDAPVAVDDAALTAEGTAVTVDATANDTDVEGDLDASSLTVVVPPSAGTALLTATPGALLYQPDPGAFGRDSLRYRVCDATGLCDSAWVRVAVGEVPVAPDLQPDEASVEGDTPLPLDVLANDVPGDYPFLPGSVAVVTPPANGTAGVDPLGGTVTYTAAFGFCGTDSFAYAACDGWGYCDTAWVTVTVLCFPPEAVDDARSGPAGDRPLVAVLDNDYAGTGGWDTASLALRFAPAHGTLEATGAAWRYVPLSDAWCGADSFGYRVANRYGLADSAVVRVTLSCAPFEARDDTARTAEATPVAIDWRANDDAEADPASFFLVAPPENGLVVGGASGVLEYRPDAGFTGTECFTYRVTATDGLRSDEATVCVRVDPVLALPDLPDLITPNGDGKNDRFDVGNLDRYPHASLTVINRWETVVYTAAPYPGDWDGTHQATGQPLPSGTYYIIFRFDDTDPASPTVQQALTILR